MAGTLRPGTMQTEYPDFVSGEVIPSIWGDDVNINLDDKIAKSDTAVQTMTGELRSTQEFVNQHLQFPIVAGLWNLGSGVTIQTESTYNYLQYTSAGARASYKSYVPIGNGLSSDLLLRKGKVRLLVCSTGSTGLDVIQCHIYKHTLATANIEETNDTAGRINVTTTDICGNDNYVKETSWLDLSDGGIETDDTEMGALTVSLELFTKNNWTSLRIYGVDVILAYDTS